MFFVVLYVVTRRDDLTSAHAVVAVMEVRTELKASLMWRRSMSRGSRAAALATLVSRFRIKDPQRQDLCFR